MREGSTIVPETATTTATTTVTPGDMPGASAATDTEKPGATTETKVSKATTTSTDATATGGLTADEKAELARYRDVHKDEQKYRREATQNHQDAEAYRNLLSALGVDDKAKAKDFDPKAAFSELNSKFESERTARIRSDVAREEGLDPDDFTGTTEEEMRASAQKYKAKLQAAVDKALQTRAPAAASASEVTAAGKVDGAKQITTRDELQKMTPKQIVEAQKSGQLDDLLTGKTT